MKNNYILCNPSFILFPINPAYSPALRILFDGLISQRSQYLDAIECWQQTCDDSSFMKLLTDSVKENLELYQVLYTMSAQSSNF